MEIYQLSQIITQPTRLTQTTASLLLLLLLLKLYLKKVNLQGNMPV
jgi:hypothetical protein